MKRKEVFRTHHLRSMAACFVLIGAACTNGYAAITNISNSPLDSGAANAVPPNLLFVLDDSGSMNYDYLPDQIKDENTCKQSGTVYNAGCNKGDPPFHAAEFNGMAYNPQITYSPAVNYLGVSLGSQTSPWTAVKVDPFPSNTTITDPFNVIGPKLSSMNLATGYPDIKYCVSSVCARNGIVSVAPSLVGTGTSFYYNSSAGFPSATYKTPTFIPGAPYYYTITPMEYCSGDRLTTCVLASVSVTIAGTVYGYAAPVRYCQTSAYGDFNPTFLAGTGAVTGNAPNGRPKCQAKHDPRTGYNYVYPRYGQFTRTNIVPATPSYGNRPLRSDCAAKPTCSYNEEMTNFANWYAYYRTRLQMMKTVAGQVFQSLDASYRVGFLTINPVVSGGAGTVSNTKFQPISEFTAAQKSAWYTLFYGQKTNGSTPLREALSRAGRYYAGKHDLINKGMDDDPVLYACQQNFTLLTTDGYWNGNGGVKLDGTTAMDNQDNVNSGRTARSLGVYDGGNTTNASGTLADVAQYYYVTDLRPAGSKNTANVDVSAAIVPKVGKDDNEEQHMTTFTLGLVDGLMRFRPDYETATSGDFAAIKTGSTGCSWTAGTCDWPKPILNQPTALDDLWHAAVNGRGSFYQASDPSGLVSGLSSALAGLKATVASSAAAAVSTPLITQTDNYVFSSTYTTVDWTGELIAETIDPITGALNTTPIWSSQTQLDGAVSASADTRTIWMFDSTVAITKLKSFAWSGMTASEKAYFQNKCVPSSNLTQCASLSGGAISTINSGDQMVGYLRGWTQNLATIFRDRKHVLGDAVNSTPAYVAAPTYGFADVVTPSYGSFKTANAARPGTIYFGGNDGMLHAINGSNGAERWAYVPKVVMPNMYKLADRNYGTKHMWLVDGSPATMDLYDGSSWRTILVGSFNGGGRGYFALDVTNPLNPKGMWEICSAATECAITDADMGFSYTTPIITKRAVDGKWVVLVTSGYNNVSTGTGLGYFYVLDALTGAVLSKVSTATGSAATPSGLGRISAWADSAYTDNTSKYAYAGDLQGNVWRIDLNVSSPTLLRLGKATDVSLVPQPITTKIELSKISGNRVVFVGTGKLLGDTDMTDPTLSGINESYQQSFYAFKDDGTDHGNLRSAGLIQQTISNVTTSTRTTTANSVNWTSDPGYFMDFNPGNTSPGERVVVDPQVVLGVLTFATNIPTMTTSCGTAGDSWFYAVDVRTGAPIPGYSAGTKNTGLQIVGYVLVQLPNGSVKIIFNYNKKQGVGDAPTGAGSTKGKRTSWREIMH